MTRRPWRLWVVTLGGAGLLPRMPGTYGSAVTAALVWLAYRFIGTSPVKLTWILFGGLVVSRRDGMDSGIPRARNDAFHRSLHPPKLARVLHYFSVPLRDL